MYIHIIIYIATRPAIRIVTESRDEIPVHSTTVLCINVVAKTDTVDFKLSCPDETKVKMYGRLTSTRPGCCPRTYVYSTSTPLSSLVRRHLWEVSWLKHV